MFPAPAILLVLPLLADHTTTDVAIGADVRNSLGLQPQVDNVVEPTNRLMLTLLSGVRVRNQRTSLVLRYLPRLTFQNPNPLDHFVPLWFQTLSATYDSAITRRLAGSLTASGEYGQLSYVDQALLFDPGSSTQDASAIRIARVRAGGSLRYQTGRTNSVSMNGVGYYQDGVADPRLDPSTVQPLLFQVSGTLTDSLRLTAADSLQFELAGARVWRDLQEEGQELFGTDRVVSNSVSLSGGWIRNTSSLSSLSVMAGVGAFNNSIERESITFFPVLTLTRDSEFRALSQNWTNSVSLGVRSFLDALRGEFRPMASISWSLGTIIFGDWNVGSQLFASTLLTESTDPEPTYDTTVRWSLPLSYSITQQLRFDLGLSAGVRLGYWETFFEKDDELAPQPFFFGFLGFRYTAGTDRESGSWL